jgi:asparagine synthase (glutamine-hydrolysing)
MSGRLARARIAVRAAGAVDREEQFRTWFAPFTKRERESLLGSLPRRVGGVSTKRHGDVIRQMLLADLESWLPDNLLERGDRMSMAASLELRPPLLDHRLVELAFRLPSNVKVRGGTTKWVLKEVARRYIPAEVVDRRKVGFRVPLESWFRSDLRDSMWDRLTGADSFVAQNFDRNAVRELLTRHESGQFNEESRIWTLMSLEIWHETFFGAGSLVPRP